MDDGFKKSEKVKFEDEKLDRARSYEEKLQVLGYDLVSSLHMLVRNVKLYGPENSIFEKPLEKLRETINTIIAVDGKLNLQCAGTSFYLNDMLLRIESKYIENIKYLHEEFERCDVGGFALDKSVNVQELRNFIYVFSKENTACAGEDGVDGRPLEVFRLRRFEIAKEILEHEKEVKILKDAKLDRRRYAIVVYARAVHFMENYLAGMRGDSPRITMAASRHIIQDLVDVCDGYRTHFLGVTTARSDASTLAYHAVNVTVLSIVFGIEIGMSKERLRELANAALFHEIGKVDLDPALLAKKEQWTPEERGQMARVPLMTIKRLLRSRSLDLGNMHNITVAYDHEIEYGKPIKDLQGKTTMVEPVADLTVYAKIVAITNGFESLTHHWGYDPESALQLMGTEWLHRFDPVFFRIFSNIVSSLAMRIAKSEDGEVPLFAPQ